MHRRLGGGESSRHTPQEHAFSRSDTAIYLARHVSFLPVEAYQLIEALPDNYDFSIQGSARASHVTEVPQYTAEMLYLPYSRLP